MHPYISPKQLQTLVQALVVSSLDYCNALYYGIHPSMLNQLQVIQNRACRTILGLKKMTNVHEHLKNLHWLKTEQRIEFKILLLVYKSLNGLAPTYLSELLSYNNISGSRTPTLQTPIPNTARAGRAFYYSAPRLWNCLPCDIKQFASITVFKNKLKTYLFHKSYPEIS